LIVTRADQIVPFLASVVLYLVLAICVALPYKVQYWTIRKLVSTQRLSALVVSVNSAKFKYLRCYAQHGDAFTLKIWKHCAINSRSRHA